VPLVVCFTVEGSTSTAALRTTTPRHAYGGAADCQASFSDNASADRQRAVRDVFQPRDRAQQRALAIATDLHLAERLLTPVSSTFASRHATSL
jgi:hypothetical protein